ncbi:XdhC/CoxI family protein [Arenimonas soli]|uniref:XdhC/CoxI family protein n=1 Tax=Arenimonas soli TaxID=2269504 RepID=A0ABQ1H8V7_9GAMM|nr:XdhC family protein [Arenimonas soli]GGA66073.1 XdhC/CoxI family protein [Arenimonas soli]
MAHGGLLAVLEAARAFRDQGQAFALALVTDTEGSTYRKAGALALVAGNGERSGTLSGGCLEPALDALAARVIASGEPEAAVLDTRDDDDLLFGSGSGCRGRMRVLAWPVPGAGQTLLDRLGDAHAARRALAVWVGVDTATLGEIAFDATLAGPGALAVQIAPAPRLLLLGAGPEAPPLLHLARVMGWLAEVVDHRPALLRAERLAGASALHALRPAQALADLAALPDAALVMTHLASADLEALRALATLDVPYVGLLGPPARRDELVAQLPAGEQARLQSRLHAPAGMPLGGHGPEAIALAIAADLQRYFHGAR